MEQNADIVRRLRAARDIALTCYYGAQAALFNFVTPDADALARTDYAGFKQHVELWFSRWDAALREFDATINAELWERIEFAARDLEPIDVAGFSFATAHQAARQSLQWWINLRATWDIKTKAAEDFAKMKALPKDSPVANLTKKKLAALKKQREVERCLALLDVSGKPWLMTSSPEIEARIKRECKLAENTSAVLPDNAQTLEPQRDKYTEARDKWLYDKCCNGIVFATILTALTKKPRTWARLDSIGGIKDAANRYAKRHKLPEIPRRNAGRPTRK